MEYATYSLLIYTHITYNLLQEECFQRYVNMSDLLHVFAKNLRLLRRRVGLSQEKLAHRAGLHRTYVGAVERCERNISLKNIERLAQALNVEPAVLLSEMKDDDNHV